MNVSVRPSCVMAACMALVESLAVHPCGYCAGFAVTARLWPTKLEIMGRLSPQRGAPSCTRCVWLLRTCCCSGFLAASIKHRNQNQNQLLQPVPGEPLISNNPAVKAAVESRGATLEGLGIESTNKQLVRTSPRFRRKLVA